MAGSRQHQVQITPDDQGPLLAITTWFFMVMMILAVLFRLAVKLGIRGSLKFDDIVLCIALLFGVVQSVVVSVAIGYGLGKRKADLNQERISKIEQTYYAANVLFIISCSAAKTSVLMLFRYLTVNEFHVRIVNISIGIVGFWMVASVFTLAFQCGAVHPWNNQMGHCINQFHFWAASGSIDMVTEIVIMVLPIMMMVPIRLALSKKLTVIIAFMFRLGVSIVIIVRLVLLHSYFASSDFSLHGVPSGMTTQILISVSITTACIPALKPFLDSFASGALSVQLRRASCGNSYELHSRGRDTKGAGTLTFGTKSRGDSNRIGYLADVTTQTEPRKSGDYPTASFGTGNSDELMIKRTDQWEVTSSGG